MKYSPEARLVCSHHLLLHAKVASTSLRTIGQPISRHSTWLLPTVALIRNPLQRWISGYAMYLYDLAGWGDGIPRFRPPRHFTYDVHTTQQVYWINQSTYLIRFEHIQEYADRCGIIIPHEHNMKRADIKNQLIEWLKYHKDFKDALKQHLRFDYQLREKCQSVQSLPANLFIK